MPSEFKAIRRVEFVDTDMAGIMHFANFFRFMESTEHAFFRSLGLSIDMEIDGQRVTFPRVHAECDYKSPLRFEDEVEVHLRIRERRAKSVAFDFTFRKSDSDSISATGSVTAVCVVVGTDGRMKAANIPESIAALLEPATNVDPVHRGE